MAALPVKRLGRPISIHDEGHVAHHRSRSAASTTRSDLVARGSVRTAWQNGIETNTLTTARPRAWINDLPILPAHFVRQLLGLNPFKTSYFSLYRSIDTLKYRLILAAAVICAIAAGIPLPIIGVIFGKIIDSFPPEEEQLLTRLYQLIGVACAYFILTYIWSCCWGVVGEKVSLGLREQLVHKVIGMDQAYFDVNAPDMTQNLTGETQAIQMGLFIQSISYFVAAFVVGFILNATLTGILFAAVIPPMFIVVSTGTTLVSKLSRKANETLEKATNVAEGAISAVQIVQAFGCADVLTQRHLELLRNAARTGFKKGLAGAIMLGSIYFIAYSANALAFWKGSKLVESGGAGTVYAVVLLILDASFVIGQFGPFVQSLALAASAGGRLLEIIDKERPVIDVYNEEGELLDQARPGDIEFHGVTFVYPARPTSRVLDAVNLKIEQGSTTAIVGTSGSGKSSAVGLILRLYDPTSGKVTIGGQDLKDLKLAQLRSCMSLVDQDPVVFSGTVMDNISMGIQDESLSNQEVMQRCVQAATDANADFIARLPQGMNTKIGGAGGTQLSGGQLQRLCLARAIVRNPAILILDEPTSALDTVSERLIMQSLKRISDSGCTIIIIAHSERDLHVSILTTGLATITSCSKIVLMEHGQVIEQGTHKSLLQNGGHYCALVEAQRLESNETNLDEDMTPDETNDVKNDIEKAVKAIVDDQEVATPKIQMGVYEIFRRAINLCTVYHYLIILGLVGSIVSGLLIVGESIIFGNLIQLLNEENATPGYRSRIDFFCLMFFVVALVALFSYSLSGSAFAVVSETLVTRTRDISLATILRQDTSWFAEPGRSRHSLQAAVSSDSGKLGGLSGVILGTIFSVTAAIVSGIILAHVVAWKIAIVLLSTVPVMLIAGFFRLRILAQFEQRQESVYSEAAALASEACGAIRTVAAFGRERGVMRQYRAAIDGPYRRSFRFILGGNLILAFSLAITYFVYALAYYWGARQVRSGNYNQREFFTVLPALLFSAQAAGQMFSLAPEVARARTAASNVFALHDERPTIMSQRGRQSSTISTDEKQQIVSESSLADTASSSPSPQEPVAHIMMKRVRFAYPLRRQTPALREVNLEVHRGQFVGIVGPSGAGKSSIILLLERFYDPTSGAVLLDGTDVRDLGVEDYRSRLALVPQEANLFPGSISFNIGLGARPGLPVSHGDIESVCKAVNLHDFIMSLPQGYNTECGNNGSQLSGGQRQRVAIARALIRKPDLLLLDEATAALDGHSERNVQDAVAAAQAQGTSCIVVAHRVKTVERADVIYVLNHGLVVEQGAHDELVAKGGLYRRMVLAQQMK